MASSATSLFDKVSCTLPVCGIIGLVGGFCFSIVEILSKQSKQVHEIPLDMCTGALVGFTWPVAIPLLGGYGLYRRIGWKVTLSTGNSN